MMAVVIVGVHEHCSFRYLDSATECLPLGHQWNDGSLGVSEPSSEIHEP